MKVGWLICLNKRILLSPENILELNGFGGEGFASVFSRC